MRIGRGADVARVAEGRTFSGERRVGSLLGEGSREWSRCRFSFEHAIPGETSPEMVGEEVHGVRPYRVHRRLPRSSFPSRARKGERAREQYPGVEPLVIQRL